MKLDLISKEKYSQPQVSYVSFHQSPLLVTLVDRET
jgi:hypothetical protein